MILTTFVPGNESLHILNKDYLTCGAWLMPCNVDVGGLKLGVESSNQDSDNICMPLLDDKKLQYMCNLQHAIIRNLV